MATKLQMFSDFICPFCYIGFKVARKVMPEFDLELEWRGFQIHPDWPAEGMPASEFRREMDPEARRAVWARIEALAEAAGFSMKPPEILTNSRLALEAAEFASEQGKGDAFEERVYRAYFHDGANIGEVETLKKIGAEAGLDPIQVEESIQAPKYELKLKNNSLLAHRHGVSGVPTFFVGNYPLVGAQPEDTMRKILTRATELVGAAK